MIVDTKYLEKVLDKLVSLGVDWKDLDIRSKICFGFSGKTPDGVYTSVTFRKETDKIGLSTVVVEINRGTPQGELTLNGELKSDAYGKYFKLFNAKEEEKKLQKERDTSAHFDSLLTSDNK